MKLKKSKVLKVKATLLAISASFASIGQTTLSPISIDVDENTRTGATVGQVNFVDGKPTRTIPIEIGKTTLSNWSTLGEEFESIPFSSAFAESPLVFGQIQSGSDYTVEFQPKEKLGGRPGVSSTYGYKYLMRQRIDNVSASGFDAVLESELDTANSSGIEEILNKGEPETFGWLAIGTEGQGVWTMSQFQALSTGTNVTEAEYNQAFSASFDGAPSIISSITTYNGSSQSGVGVYKLNKSSADIYIDEIDDNSHPAENVNILALSGNGFVAHADDNLTETVPIAEYGQIKVMDTGIDQPFEVTLNKPFRDPVVFVQAVGADTHIYDAAVRLTSIESNKFTGYLHSNLERLSEDRFGEFTLHYQVFEAGEWAIPLENYDYEIISGNETGAFALDPQSGKIKVADQTQLDFESGNNQFTFTVRVTDGLGNEYDTQVTINVNDINDSLNNDAQAISGLVADDWTGWSIAPAGDVNGDSFDDIIVGSPQSDFNGTDSGVAYVLFSNASGTFPTLDQVQLQNQGFAIFGAAEGDNAGFAVAGGVDINGDGLSDVVVGAPYSDVNGAESGSTYVVFGKTNTNSVLLADLTANDNSSGFAIHGAYSRDLTGGTLVVGDVNGDGLGDVVIGETVVRSLVDTLVYEGGSFLEEQYADPNMAYVVYGKKDGNALNLAEVAEDDNTSGYVVYRSNLTYLQDWQFGAQVLPTGDFNSDGLTDFIVNRGLHGEDSGVNKLVYGRIGGTSVNYRSVSKDGNGIDIVAEEGFYAYDFYTSALNTLPAFTTSNVGDVNADGIDDIALMLTDIDCCNGVEYPRAYILFGGVNLSDEINLADIATGNGGFIIHNDASNIEFASLKTVLGSIGGAGDLNGDGFDDIIIGDPYAENKKGRVYAVYGRAGTDPVYLSQVIETGQGFYSEGNGSAQLGQMISGAGDVNADGIKDIQFGVPSATSVVDSTELSNSGAVYVLHGDGKLVTHWGTANNDNIVADANANNIATGAGDDTVTGNGGADAIYTGPGNDTITISDVNFTRIDGGGGTDTIELTGSGHFLNLAEMSAKVRSIEVFDIRGSGANELSINKSASGNSNIRIIGDNDDIVYAANNQWQDTGTTRVVDNVTYKVYQVGDAEMLVQVGVTTEINNVPTINDQSFSIVESAVGGASIGHVVAASNDIGDFVTYAILGDTIFDIDVLTGEVSIDSSVPGLDYETTPSYTFTVQVTDSYGATDAATMTVNVNDLASIVHSFETGFTGSHGAFGSSAVLDLLGFNTADLDGYELAEGQSKENGGKKVYMSNVPSIYYRDPLFYYETSGQMSFQPTFITQGSAVDVDMPVTMDLAYADEIQLGQETLITTQVKLDKEANFLANSPGFYFDLEVGFHDLFFGYNSPLRAGADFTMQTEGNSVFGLSSAGLDQQATSIAVRSQHCSASFVYTEMLDYFKGLNNFKKADFVDFIGGLEVAGQYQNIDYNTPIPDTFITEAILALIEDIETFYRKVVFVENLDEATLLRLIEDFDFKAHFGSRNDFDARCLTDDYKGINQLAIRATIDDPNWYSQEVYWGQHAYQWLAPYIFETHNKDVEQCVSNYFDAVGGDDLYTTQKTTIVDAFVSARVKLEQYFHIDIRPIATLTLEDGTQLFFNAEEDIKFTPEQAHDANNDGIIDADLTVEVKAVFGNDSYFYPELYSPLKVGMFEYEQQEADCSVNPIVEYGKGGMQYSYESFGPYIDKETSYKIALNVMGDEVERGFAHLMLPTEDGELTGEFTETDISESLIEADDTGFENPNWSKAVNNILNPDDQLDRKSQLEFVIAEQTFSKSISFDLCSSAGACGEPVLSYKNNAPVASNIQFSGDFIGKQTVTASYDYSDYEDHSETDTIIQWFRAADEQGTNIELITEDVLSYTLTNADVDNYVRFCVKPHDGYLYGVGVCSDWQSVASSYYKDMSVLTGFGQAMIFDGATQSVLQSNSGQFNPDESFTIETWFNVNQYNTDSHNNILTFKAADGTGRAALRVVDDGTLRIKATDQEFYTSAVVSKLNKWYHLAVTYDSNTQQMNTFVDGVNVLSETDTSTFGATDFVWGANKNQGNSLFNGKLDEIRVWSVARTEQEIADNMNAAVSFNDVDLFSYINFDGGNTNYVTERVSGSALSTKADASYEKHRSYVSLDGYVDLVEIPHNADFSFSQQDLTVQAWFYVTGNADEDRPIVFKRDKLNYRAGWGLRLNKSEKLQFLYSQSSANKTITSDQVLGQKQWYHVAVSVDRSTGLASMYINGIFEKSVDVSNITFLGNSNPLRIGQYSANGSSASEVFKGYIDDVAIWQRALTESEIQTCMQSMQRGCDSNLVAFYDFEGGNVQNKAQNKFHGSATNGATLVEDFPVSYQAVAGQTLSAGVPVADGVYFEVISKPAYGTWSFNKSTGEFDYTPPANKSGETDSFSYMIYDANDGYSLERTVTITIE